MKILVINQPNGNRGDESAHKALMKSLSGYENIEIINAFYGSKQRYSEEAFTAFIGNDFDIPNLTYVNCHTGWLSSRLPYRTFFMPSPVSLLLGLCSPAVRKMRAMIRSSDLVICAPGGVCMGTYKNWVHVWLLYMALRFERKLAIYSRSFGPFSGKTKEDEKFKSISIEILQKAAFLSLRDSQSQGYAKDLGINYIEAVDTAFLEKPAEDIPEEYSFLKNKEYIVFVPNELYAWHPYFKNIQSDKFDAFYKDIIDALLSKGFHLVMLPQTCIPATRLDYSYFKKLSSSYPDKITVVTDTFHSDDQQAIIRSAKMVVGARYHSIVFAINNVVPFVSLSYEHKMSGMLDLLDLNDMCYGLKENGVDDAGKVNAMIDAILNKYDDYKRRVDEASKYAGNLANNCFSEFMRFVKELDGQNRDR